MTGKVAKPRRKANSVPLLVQRNRLDLYRSNPLFWRKGTGMTRRQLARKVRALEEEVLMRALMGEA